MAVFAAKGSAFRLVPEGEVILKVIEIDDTKFSDFGELKLTLQDAEGSKAFKTFFAMDKDGNTNDKVIGFMTYFGRTLVNDQTLEEIDTKDWLGKYALFKVTHEIKPSTKKPGENYTQVNIDDIIRAVNGFEKTSTPVASGSGEKPLSPAERLAQLRAKAGK